VIGLLTFSLDLEREAESRHKTTEGSYYAIPVKSFGAFGSQYGAFRTDNIEILAHRIGNGYTLAFCERPEDGLSDNDLHQGGRAFAAIRNRKVRPPVFRSGP